MADETLNTTEVDTNTQENPRDGGEERQGNKKGKTFFRKKVCRFCAQKAKIDYKDPDSLRRCITGTCAKHQRKLALEIKRARALALLPYVVD